MSVKAMEDAVSVVKVVLLETLKAMSKDGFQWTDVGAFLQSPDFQASFSKALPELADIPTEAINLTVFDDLELARYLYNVVLDVVAALKTLPKVAA